MVVIDVIAIVAVVVAVVVTSLRCCHTYCGCSICLSKLTNYSCVKRSLFQLATRPFAQVDVVHSKIGQIRTAYYSL